MQAFSVSHFLKIFPSLKLSARITRDKLKVKIIFTTKSIWNKWLMTTTPIKRAEFNRILNVGKGIG